MYEKKKHLTKWIYKKYFFIFLTFYDDMILMDIIYTYYIITLFI